MLGILEWDHPICVCFVYMWPSHFYRNDSRGPDSPRLRSQHQPGQDYHITDRIPPPYKVIHERDTDLINMKVLFEISLLSIFRHKELIDSISASLKMNP